MRVFEATFAGLVVALAAGIVAWRVEADTLLIAAVAFLIGFAGWASTGKTITRHGNKPNRKH